MHFCFAIVTKVDPRFWDLMKSLFKKWKELTDFGEVQDLRFLINEMISFLTGIISDMSISRVGCG